MSNNQNVNAPVLTAVSVICEVLEVDVGMMGIILVIWAYRKTGADIGAKIGERLVISMCMNRTIKCERAEDEK